MDTNLIVRFIAEDHDSQVDEVQRFLDERTARNPAYVSTVVLCEVAWTLARVYRRSRADVAAALEKILSMPIVQVERGDLAAEAVKMYRGSRADFGDCCIAALASLAGCEYTLTFDKDASKLPGMRLLGDSQA